MSNTAPTDTKNLSSLKYKINVADLPNTYVDALYQLRPVEYDFTADVFGGKHSIGLIAEEVVNHIPEVVLYKELDGTVDGLDYEKLIAPLIKIAQDNKVTIQALQDRIERLEAASPPPV